MGNQSVTLLVSHKSDIGSETILTEVSTLTKTQVLESYFSVCVETGSSAEKKDFAAEFVITDGHEQCFLLDRLSRIGVIDRLRIVCINASTELLDETVSIDIAAFVLRVRTALDQLLGSSVAVSEIRVGVRGYGEAIPCIDFFPISSHANVLVIPHDRVSEGAAASPIIRSGDQSNSRKFALHGAIEVASLIGLWRSMDHAPVDNFLPSVAGTEVSRLRFCQSRVRVLIGPPLPMIKIAEPVKDLPLPLQHFAVSNSRRGAVDLVETVFPSGLVFVPEVTPDFLLKKLGGLRALIEFLKEIGRSIFLLPKFIIKGIGGEFNSLSSNMYQEMLGAESMVEILGASSTDVGTSVGLSGAEFEKIIESVTKKSSRELVSPISRDHWAIMITRFFGALDGGPSTREMRQMLFSNENILLVDRVAAGWCSDDLNREITGLLQGDARPIVGQQLSTEEKSISSDPTNENEVSNTGDATSSPIIDVVEQPTQSSEADVEETPRRNLVEMISDCFLRERKKANARSEEMIKKIRLLFEEMKSKVALEVSTAVVVAAWSALCSIVFVLLTCTPLRKALSFSALSGYQRDALWTSFSGLFVILAILLLGYGGKKTWQIRALVTGAAVGVVITICLVWFDDLRNWIQTKDQQTLPAVLLALATLALLGTAIFKNLTSKSAARQQLGRAFLLVTSIYMLTSLVLWQCMKSESLQTAQPATRKKVLFAVLIVAGLIFVSSLGVVALVQIRERLRLRKNADLLEWCRSQLEISVEAERRLAAAQTQWAATGSVLGRLLTHPLGMMDRSVKDVNESLSSDEAILKYDVARLQLNEHGEAGLVARLRRHFVEPGWLSRQYEKMVRRFQEQAAFRSGNRIDDLIDRRPEIDPIVNSVDRARKGAATGDRWDFARSVFRGDYDSELGSVPDQLNLEEVYQSVLDNSDSYEIVGSQLVGASAREFFQQVLPTPTMELPIGLTKSVFTASDNLRKIKSEIWWPKDILGEPPLDNSDVVVNSSSSMLSSFFAGSVLLVGIRVDFSEPFSYFDCVGAVEAESKPQSEISNSEQSDF